MAGFNGNGVFVRTYSWVNDKANGIDITASRVDTEDNGFASGLSTCICKDGQQTTTARIPFAVGLSVNQGLVGTPSLSVIGDPTTGFYQTTGGSLSFASSGSAVSSFTATGLQDITQTAGNSTTQVATTAFVNSTALTLATGTTAVTQASSDNSTKVATTAFANTAVTTYIGANPLTLANGTTATTQAAADATTKVATTAFVNNTALTLAAGTTGVTQSAGDATTKVATTAYVDRGASGASEVLIGTVTASNSATVAFTSIPGTYKFYVLRIQNAAPTITSDMRMRFSENNGGAYISTGYSNSYMTIANSGTPSAGGSGVTAQFEVGGALSAAVDNSLGINAKLEFNALGAAGVRKEFWHEGMVYDGSNFRYFMGGGDYSNSTNAINAIQFFYASGNISVGTFSLYGVRST